jgi:hypothetical protein
MQSGEEAEQRRGGCTRKGKEEKRAREEAGG